jgi:class 3 adenylate cyclase
MAGNPYARAVLGLTGYDQRMSTLPPQQGKPEPDELRRGREAAERFSWQEAIEHLSAADRTSSLGAGDLERLAEAAYWLGRMEDSIAARERAFRVYEQVGDRGRAARMALDMAKFEFGRHRRAIGSGWLSRAERILANEPESVHHGYLERLRAVIAFEGRHDAAAALMHAERALDIGTRSADSDLMALALHDKGRILIDTGKVTEGQALIDEATVAAIGGDLLPMTTGIIYCNTIDSCESLADYGRAGEWTEAAKRWCERVAIAGFPGLCRVHRATVMRMRGEWGEAEREARRASDELRGFNLDYAGAAFYEIGEARRYAGDLPGAEEAFRQAHELGREPEPGLSLVRLTQGNVTAAASSIRRAIGDATLPPLRRARLLPAQVEIAVAANDLETARTASAELRDIALRFGTPALAATAALTAGSVALAEHDTETAIRELKTALRSWQDLDAPYEVARARVGLALAYRMSGDEEAAALELDAARAAFERLGARTDVVRVAVLQGGTGTPARVAGQPVRRVFIFTDIVGSTPLAGALGDNAWSEVMRWHDETVRSLIAAHGGEEVDHAGDGFFAAFEDAGRAIDCAVSIERKLAEHRRMHGFAPEVRIGVHMAGASKRGGGYEGVGVHEAARIASIAAGGEIAASAETVGPRPRYATSMPRAVQLKGIAQPVDVVTIDWH